MNEAQVTRQASEERAQPDVPMSRSRTAPARQVLSRRKIWVFRLAAMTIVPALILTILELLLRLIGYGHPASFFLKKSTSGTEIYVENLDFGRRFFPPGLAREPLPAVFPAQKRPGTLRIFVFGESAAMGFPESSFSFARILEVLLKESFPRARFEIINTSMTAINSHVILPIARDCAGHQPDLFIVYMGNNEVVGPFGASGVLGPVSQNLSLIRAGTQIKATRVGELISTIPQKLMRHRQSPRRWDGMAMFADSQIRENDPRMASVYSHFENNLQDICEAGRTTGAKVVVCTVGCNLRDSPPFASLLSPGTSPPSQAEWSQAYQEGIRRELEGDPARAVENYETAARIDARHAELQFRWANCLMACQRPDEARSHFRLARDCDTLRFRADTSINSVIRFVASDREAEGVILADIERALELSSAYELPGQELFCDHVHLTFFGNYLLARVIFERLIHLFPASLVDRRGDPLSEPECQEWLAFTDWNRLNSLQALGLLFGQPPFSDQFDAQERVRRLQRQAEALRQRLQAGGFSAVDSTYRRALQRSGQDFVLHMEFAILLMSQGRFDEAAGQVREVQGRLPHHPGPHVMMARLLAAQGRVDEALAECDAALALQPDSQQALEARSKLRLIRKKNN